MLWFAGTTGTFIPTNVGVTSPTTPTVACTAMTSTSSLAVTTAAGTVGTYSTKVLLPSSWVESSSSSSSDSSDYSSSDDEGCTKPGKLLLNLGGMAVSTASDLLGWQQPANYLLGIYIITLDRCLEPTYALK